VRSGQDRVPSFAGRFTLAGLGVPPGAYRFGWNSGTPNCQSRKLHSSASCSSPWVLVAPIERSGGGLHGRASRLPSPAQCGRPTSRIFLMMSARGFPLKRPGRPGRALGCLSRAGLLPCGAAGFFQRSSCCGGLVCSGTVQCLCDGLRPLASCRRRHPHF